MTDTAAARGDSDLPFGSAAADYDRLRFHPSEQSVSWLLRGDERRVLDLAAGTGQVTGQLLPLGLDAVAVEPDARMRAVFRTRYPGTECLDGAAEAIPLPDDSVDAVVVGAAWHWFDEPAALAEISRVLRDGGRLGVFATSMDVSVGWVRDMYSDASLRAQQRGDDTVRGVTLPPSDFGPVEEIVFTAAQTMDTADIVAWFRTHSTYRKADERTRQAMEDKAAGVLGERFGGQPAVDVPVITLCWRTGRLPRSKITQFA